MRTRKVYGVLFLALVIFFVMALTTLVLAGGYKPFESGTKYTTSPHGGFTNNTNFCKTCHAVHIAGEAGYNPSGGTDPLGDAWRLLRASSAEDACFYCHEGAGAHTNKIQYDRTLGVDAWGEHQIGETVIPDSNLNNASPSATSGSFPGGVGLTCNMCHSVHGAGTVASGDFSDDIVRKDPASDGDNVNEADADSAVITFCADCHTLNESIAGAGSGDPTTNPHAHPMKTNGILNVNGVPTVVSSNNASSCIACHSASGTEDAATPKGNFPHQSIGHKLLPDWYDRDGADNVFGTADDYPLPGGENVNNAQRQLPKMDAVCLTGCHAGLVGVTF